MATTQTITDTYEGFKGTSLMCDELDGCVLEGNSGYVTAGDCVVTTAGTDATNITIPNNSNGIIRCFSGTTTATYIGSSTSYITTDKSVIYGKEGDVMMDIQNMKFKVYCGEKGWVEYDIEDFSTKTLEGKKRIVLEGIRETNVSEIIAERNKRKVLVEKMPKQKDVVLISGGIWLGGMGTSTITINPYNGFYQPNTVYYGTAGTINTAIGTTALGTGTYNTVTAGVTSIATGTNNASTVTMTGNAQVNGNITVNGNMKVDGDLTVNGTMTCVNVNNV